MKLETVKVACSRSAPETDLVGQCKAAENEIKSARRPRAEKKKADDPPNDAQPSSLAWIRRTSSPSQPQEVAERALSLSRLLASSPAPLT